MKKKLKISQEARMLFHVCKICGKEFSTPQGLYGHSRIHSSMSEINEAARNFVLFSERAYGFKKPSFMTEIEQLELNEAATSLEMLSERLGLVTNLPIVMDSEQEKIIKTSSTCSDAIAMGLEPEKITQCADSKQVLSDVVAQALPSPLRRKLQKESSRECKICGKIFGCYQALGGHIRVHRSITDGLKRMKKDSEAKKVVLQPSCFEVSQDDLIKVEFSELGGTAMDLDVKSMQEKIIHCARETSSTWNGAIAMDFEQEKIIHQDLSHETFGTCRDVVAQVLPSPLRSKLRKQSQTKSSYDCSICGKTFGCFQALGGHKRVHRSITGQLKRIKEEDFEDGSSGAKNDVPQPSCFQVSQEDLIGLKSSELDGIAMDLDVKTMQEKIIHCAHETSTTCSDVVAQALPSPLRSKSQTKSTYECNICGKIFRCCQALNGHKNAHRSSTPKKDFEDGNSLFWSTDSGAKKVVPQPSCFEVSQDDLIAEHKFTDVKEHCVESNQDFSELFSHSGFENVVTTFSDVVSQALPSSGLQKKTQGESSYVCNICSKSFGCCQALCEHKRVHRSITGQPERIKNDFEDFTSPYEEFWSFSGGVL